MYLLIRFCCGCRILKQRVVSQVNSTRDYSYAFLYFQKSYVCPIIPMCKILVISDRLSGSHATYECTQESRNAPPLPISHGNARPGMWRRLARVSLFSVSRAQRKYNLLYKAAAASLRQQEWLTTEGKGSLTRETMRLTHHVLLRILGVVSLSILLSVS